MSVTLKKIAIFNVVIQLYVFSSPHHASLIIVFLQICVTALFVYKVGNVYSRYSRHRNKIRMHSIVHYCIALFYALCLGLSSPYMVYVACQAWSCRVAERL